jgi:hypothetical protein
MILANCYMTTLPATLGRSSWGILQHHEIRV